MAETAFWSAIAGAIVGGLIAYAIQTKMLREAKKQRAEDRLLSQKALGIALLLKMAKVHSNLHHINKGIECDLKMAKPQTEPWQFVRPTVNFPNPIHFSPEEMGMLFALNSNDVFNLVLQMDVSHNSIIEVMENLKAEHSTLVNQLPVHGIEGAGFVTNLNPDQALALRPQMDKVNMLFKGIQDLVGTCSPKTQEVMNQLNKILRDKLGLTTLLEFE